MLQKILGFIASILAALWIGLFWFGDGTLHYVVIYLSYPMNLLAFSIFAVSLYKLYQSDLDVRRLLPLSKSAFITIAVVSALLLSYEPIEFKIVYDEVILSSIGEFMHFDRLAGLPREANDFEGYYVFQNSILDKRPFFFPFLLSLTHDIFGFRYENVFVLNGALTVILISLIYMIGKILGNHHTGLLSILLALTLPLLATFSSSGHFEILNLVMLSLVFILSYLYLKKPDKAHLIPLVFSLILLGQVRYENIIYLLPFGILILMGWHVKNRVILPLPVILSPFFFSLSCLQYRMILNSSHGFFQSGPMERTETFSLSYIQENLSSALRYFFSVGQMQPNSILLTVFGLTGLGMFLYYGLKKPTLLTGKNAKATTLFIFTMAIALFTVVVCVFNFGLFDRFITSRLSLPIQLFLIIVPAFVIRRFGKHYVSAAMLLGCICTAVIFFNLKEGSYLSIGLPLLISVFAYTSAMAWIWKKSSSHIKYILLIPIFYTIAIGIPVGRSHIYAQDYKSNDLILREMEFIESRKNEEKILWVSRIMYSALLTRTNGITIDRVSQNPQILKDLLERKFYNSIYIARRFELKESGEFGLVDSFEYIDESIFKLDTVKEVTLEMNVLIRFSRITDVFLPDDINESAEKVTEFPK